MKKIALTICALTIVAFSFGQKTQETKQSVNIDKSKLQFNFGVGVSTWGFPIYLGADYWITEEITVGLEASFRYRLLHEYGYIGGSVNGNYHVTKILQLPDNVDVYAGLSAGPYIGFGKYFGGNFDFGIGAQVGGRYKINERMWVNAEVGGGTLSGGKIGITLRR